MSEVINYETYLQSSIQHQATTTDNQNKLLEAIAQLTKQQEIDQEKRELKEREDLRNYFAAAALSGLTSATDQDGTWAYGYADKLAETVYEIADAMLEVRERK